MKLKSFLRVLLLAVVATSLGCATMQTAGHKYIMRGSVLEVSDGNAYICLGTEQGAQVGQEFRVYRYVKSVTSPKVQPPQYKVETVGRVKITSVESHMANAQILNGNVKPNDIVELNQ